MDKVVQNTRYESLTMQEDEARQTAVVKETEEKERKRKEKIEQKIRARQKKERKFVASYLTRKFPHIFKDAGGSIEYVKVRQEVQRLSREEFEKLRRFEVARMWLGIFLVGINISLMFSGLVIGRWFGICPVGPFFLTVAAGIGGIVLSSRFFPRDIDYI